MELETGTTERQVSQTVEQRNHISTLTGEKKALIYWRLSLVWNRRAPASEMGNHNIGSLLDTLSMLRDFTKTLPRLSDAIGQLLDNIIRSKRCRKTKSKGPTNVVSLATHHRELEALIIPSELRAQPQQAIGQ